MTTSDRHESFDSSLYASRPVIWLCRVLCFVALVISGYLAWSAFNSSEVAGCGGGSVFDCGHVLTSKYAKVLGLPVSVPAFGLYASLLGVLFFMRKDAPPRFLRAGWTFLTVGAFSAGLAALWFISIQVFELEHLCSYCLGAHTCGLLLTALVLWKRPLGGFRTSALSSISMAGVAGLIAIQVNSEEPQTYVVETYDVPEPTQSAESEGDAVATTFEAPPVFEAPGAAEVIEPPVFEPPVFEPPGVSKPVEVRAAKPVRVEDDDQQPTEPVTDASERGPEVTSVSQEEVVAADDENGSSNEDEAAQTDDADAVESSKGVVAAAAFLFISPSTARVASRLLTWDEDATAKDEGDEVASDDAAPAAAAPEERLVTVAGKRFSLNTRHWPILGSPDAKYVFVEMFDYTCPHCRRTHQTIDEAFNKFGDDLAIIALAVPLDGKCNDTVRSTSSSHRNACELAKIAIAVWRVAPDQFKQFHDWMFEGQRSTSAAKAYAEKLVGKDRLQAELDLPHAESYISRHVDLYKRVGQGSVPKLMFPRSTMTGSVTSSRALISAIERELVKQ